MRRERVVLFIVTSFWAFGELTIATEFARRMAGTGYRPLFLIPPTHQRLIASNNWEYQLLIPNAGKINRIQLADIQMVHRPALVVLADFLNYDFCDRHYGLRREDLKVFDCPVGTFDNFTWGRPGAWLDTYGFKAKYQAQMELGDVAFRLRPCPLNNPRASGAGTIDSDPDPTVHTHALLDHSVTPAGSATPAVRRVVKDEIGVAPDRPLVLLTGATWQQMHVAYPRVTAFVEACRMMLERLITRITPAVSVAAIGPPIVFTDRPAPDGFVQLGQLEPPRFADVVRAGALHISNNLVSVSLHRLALGGIPSIALVSSLAKTEDGLRSVNGGQVLLSDFAADVIGSVDYLYPVRMFPVGWYHFLDSLLAGNPFSDVVHQVEVFDEEAAVGTVHTILDSAATRDRVEAARRDYLDALAGLPEVGTILNRVTTEVHA
jgi:hypothetical protein